MHSTGGGVLVGSRLHAPVVVCIVLVGVRFMCLLLIHMHLQVFML